MMHRIVLLHIGFSIILAGLASGCSQAQRIFYRAEPAVASTPGVPSTSNRFMLAAGQASTDNPALRSTLQNQSKPAASSQRATSQPTTPQPAYTTPGEAFRQIGLAVAAMTLGMTAETVGAGREAAQANAFSFGGISQAGRLGLTAPATVIDNSVVGREGLERGEIRGLGFGNRDRNIFTPQVNALSGPTGGCQSLTNAGFFSSRGACEHHFGH